MIRVLTYILTRDKSKGDFGLLKELCHNSKNLFNYVNYVYRQAFAKKPENIPEFQDLIQNDRFISDFPMITRLTKIKQPDYVALKAQCSQQVVMQVSRSWKSFFKANKAFKSNKTGFTGRPKLPKYKDKDGLNVLTFTNQCCSFDKKSRNLKIARGVSIDSVKLPEDVSKFQQVRIVPKNGYFQIDVVYEKGQSNDIEQTKKNNSRKFNAGIDIGVDNLATVTSDNPETNPIIVNGKCVKSINQFFNKELAKIKQVYSRHGIKTGRKSRKLTLKRKNKIDDYFHKMSKHLVGWCVENNIGKVFVGHNPGWKQKVNMGRVNNQTFVQIPFDRFIQMLRYKLSEVEIEVEIVNEAYTSKCSALDKEEIGKHEVYLGKRVKRGLFKTKDGKLLNADVNGSLNILRRGLNKDFELSNKIFNPQRKHEVHNASFRKPVNRGSVLEPIDEKSSMNKTIKRG